MATVAFDQSLSVFVQAAVDILGVDILAHSWFLRDSVGRITLVCEPQVDSALVAALSKRLSGEMLPYIRPDRVLVPRNAPGVDVLFDGAPANYQHVSVQIDGEENIVFVRVIDRRIVGRDWQSQPIAGWKPPAPARLVFASLKGGVGRSTALAVLACDLAQDGKNVLVVDLDLEAPGIGAMLVGVANRPLYGVLDWMVETNLCDVDADFLTQMVAPSDFSGGRGVIDVVPAVGTASTSQPQNVISKIARAYLENVREGADETFLGKVRRLVDALSQRRSYDAILIDARAGLHETTAASILGLGADVLFFGMNSAQTFESYKFLFAQMRDVLNVQGLARPSALDIVEDESAESPTTQATASDVDDQDPEERLMPSQVFVRRLKFVHAKAPRDEDAQTRFRDKLHELFSDTLYASDLLDVEQTSEDTLEFVAQPEFGLDDETGPHYAWPIFGSTLYAEFDPLARPTPDQEGGGRYQLAKDSYEEAFGEFLTYVRERIRIPRTVN